MPLPNLRHFVGLDLGQTHQFSALAVLERPIAVRGYSIADVRPPYALRHLERYPPGTPYPEIAAGLRAVLTTPAVSGAMAMVDVTGVGRAVVDLLRTLPIRGVVRPLTITSGSRARADASGRWRVPKKLLVANVQRLLGAGRLKIADGLPEAAALVRELADFRVTTTTRANETFGAGSRGGHDDLVVALALAVWGRNFAPGCEFSFGSKIA